ncbi:SGNH/GDSL hydrolase family protein [Mesorhizobium sp. M2A.F.Ca.ET.039.01.1.1]|uniref:SGNH/GDSL hydrolase family protein n=1 Tax=Mesorhizobium sp. M2A.F.Ca.ET.039.01.1.1 TaxID=2496746 RepID=UPI000FCA5DAF|nr:SGNH/GDSL hydrolase family protein [Mesorhizobium sp. M2A.F.Ca.ET.039.01.1.1]RWX70665.1 SGNH/GDSL hydrolase family protein [Mesorhizobium sp. M2A.F.Ca.ET.039.01.1.1]
MPFKLNLRAAVGGMARNAAAGTLAMAVVASAATGGACAKDQTWIATWAASPHPSWQGDFPLPTFLPFNLWHQTVRQKVRVSLGGDRLRIVLSNEYGKAPLAIESVHVALPGADGASIDPATDHVVTFSGAQKLSIPSGAPAVSDPIDLKLAARGDLVVTFLVVEPMPIDTFHWDAEATSYIGAGDQVANPTISQSTKTMTRIFLSDVLVETAPGAKAVVAFGDSITDGASSGVDQNARWPDFLAENLAPHGVAVLNAGIAGARLLNTRMGENAMARFSRDVLSVPNIKTVVVLIGINDISWPGQAFGPNDPFLTKEQLVAGYRQLIAIAHAHNIRIVAGTLTPFEAALQGSPLEGYYSKKRDELRQEINAWIRTCGEFDAVVDLDKLVADPGNPLAIKSDLQADYLHLSPKGNKMVADVLTPTVLFGNQ